MASNQQMPQEQQQQNSKGIGTQEQLVTRLLSARAMAAFLLLCVLGLAFMLMTFIVPFLRSDPGSLLTQLTQQVGITFFVTGIISIVAGSLINNTRNQLQNQISDFLQNVVTGRLDEIQQDTADQTKHLEAEVTRKLEGIQDDFKMQTAHLKAEVTGELENIQENIRQQTNSFVATSASLQTMGIVGMSRMYLKRDDAIEDIKQDLANLNLSKIRLVGISLNDFVRDGGVFHGIWKIVTEYIQGGRTPPNADRKLAVQVLIIDPICLGAHLRSKGEHRESKAVVQSRLAKDVDFTKDSLFELEEAVMRNGPEADVSFSFRLYQFPPMFFLLSTDAASYIQPYYFWRSRDPAIPLPLMRYSGNSLLHNGLNDHFEWIWNKASISSTEYFDQYQLGLDKGLRQSGVINVFDDPNDAKKRILSLIAGTKKRLYLQGFSLRSFFDGENILYWTIKDLAEQKDTDIDIKVLLINPSSEQALYRSYREYRLENPRVKMSYERFKEDTYKSAQLYRDTERSVRWLRKIVPSDAKFCFRWYDTAPYCFMLMVDDSVLVEQYHYGKVGPLVGTKILGTDMARYEYAREPRDLYDTDKPLQTYQLWESHFDFVFNECAQEIPPTFGPIGEDEAI